MALSVDAFLMRLGVRARPDGYYWWVGEWVGIEDTYSTNWSSLSMQRMRALLAVEHPNTALMSLSMRK